MSRRRVLAGTATLAAAGSGAAVFGLAQLRGGGEAAAATTLPTQAPLPVGTAAPVTAAPSALSSEQWAAHLLRRAGFGGTAAEVAEFAALDREEAVSRLVDYETIDNSSLEERLDAAGFQLTPTEERQSVVADMHRWWLTRMAYTARPLEERMTLILHGLLTSQVSKIGPIRAHWMLWQNDLFRSKAMTAYDGLVQAVAKDPAMLVYLDTVESSAEHPNENFPRELMELFTMGEGAYTEDDVREAARAFTGWRLTQPARPPRAELAGLSEEDRQARIRAAAYTFRPEFYLDAGEHDGGEKTFLGHEGPWDGDDVIRLIMAEEATARFITTRLWREFAYDGPEPQVIDRLVETWNATGHSLREVVRAILLSDEFASSRAYFARVRSPVEVLVGLVRALELEPASIAATGRGRRGNSGAYEAMGQVLFEPLSVAGWPGGAAWLSSSTFFARANFTDELLFPGGRAVEIPALASTEAGELVDAVALRLIDGVLTAGAREAIVTHVASLPAGDRAATAAYLVAGSPGFQLV